MVWNGLTALPPVSCDENCPVTNGTFWPTTISASSLSSVTRLGVERMLLLASEDSARIRTAKSVPSSSSEMPPIDSPVPMLVGSEAMPTMFDPAPPKLVSAAGPSSSVASAANCTPSSRALSSDSSAMIASTSTCARRMSSWRTICSRSRSRSGGPVTISELVFGSAWMMTCSAPVLPAPSSPPPSWPSLTPCRMPTRSSALA